MSGSGSLSSDRAASGDSTEDFSVRVWSLEDEECKYRLIGHLGEYWIDTSTTDILANWAWAALHSGHCNVVQDRCNSWHRWLAVTVCWAKVCAFVQSSWFVVYR